ncbi:MAG: hypothetical protein KGL39_48110 [Patescibacteria group bacterium]|nr:hypothetical protein [Patescibacteria group bacterium]
MATLPVMPEDDTEILIDEADPDAPKENTDDDGNLLSIEYPDGSITLSLDGVLESATGSEPEWFDNLAMQIDQMELSRIAEDLLRGIADDIESRKDWVDNRAYGIRLLGLKLEQPNTGGPADGAPLEGMSKVRHPLLLEAVLRFQANARSELLPTDGPVKIRNDDNNATYKEDVLANALERDLNHYLTSTASEYYPDTDRMLLLLGFGGTAFKKVYFCPLRNRPVSESVDADDLIVNNAATDLLNAKRVTHKIMMRPTVVRRMQILNVYRDVNLGTPLQQKMDAALEEKRETEGIKDNTLSPEDRDREIYECYCELDIRGFEHKYKGKVSGLEVPYRVTIDVSSREILSIVRNYDESTQELPIARRTFVKYTFVPGFGFYDIGLLHILGNTTSALTAAWREMLDNGMYANFPGFLFADTGGRQNTNIFRVPPGGGAPIKTNGMSISQSVMPLPYQTGGMAPLMALTQDMATTGQRVGGTAEIAVGEGRPDAPVGTTMANMEQALKILDAVHKRLHASQADEFRLICQCFEEHPESFWERNFMAAYPWDEQTFLLALKNYDLTPQADPNTASHGQRIMKIMALKQLQAQNPSLYDPVAIDTAALQTIGWSNPQQFFAPPSAAAAPPPELIEAQAKMVNDGKEADAKLMDAQTRQAELQAKVQSGAFEPKQQGNNVDPAQGQAALISAHANLMNAETKQKDLGLQAAEGSVQNENRDLDRQSDERIALLNLAKELVTHPEASLGQLKPMVEASEEAVRHPPGGE